MIRHGNKGIEEMTKEELIDLVDSLNKNWMERKRIWIFNRAWKDREESDSYSGREEAISCKSLL